MGDYKHLIGKKLLILGGNPETGELVNKARELGVYTIVADPNKDAPAKVFADKKYEIDGLDVHKLYHMAKQEQVDGVLVGVADILVPSYFQLCEALNLPCYAGKNFITALTNKDGFMNSIRKYNIMGIPSFKLNENMYQKDINKIEYPVMIKPVDNGGGVGMSLCHSEVELEEGVLKALKNSKQGVFLTEKFMDCDDMLVYYTFINGEIYLSAIADRVTTKKQGNLSPVCIAALYPSKYTDQYYKNIHPKMVKMFHGLGINNGVLSVQFFVDNNTFYAYDPGFRLQGEAPHIMINAVNGFDHRSMLINFALTGSMGGDDIVVRNDFLLKGKSACTLWVLVKAGKIKSIRGLDSIMQEKSVVHIMQRFTEGNEVLPTMMGNEKQVLARIYIVTDSREKLIRKIKEIKLRLSVNDELGNNMIIDQLEARSVAM